MDEKEHEFRIRVLSDTEEISRVEFVNPPEEVESPYEGLNKKLICKADEFKVYLVNGEFIRNNLETDFTMGSNSQVSKFIPKKEVWIDDKTSDNDILALIYHEIVETRLMKKGVSYEDAHAAATEAEKEFRKSNFH